MMIPLVKELVSSHTNHLCIWYCLTAVCDAVLTGGCYPPVWGRGGRMGSEMGPLSRPGTTSYRLPTVTTCLSLTVYAVLRMLDRRTDRQTDGLAIGGTMH